MIKYLLIIFFVSGTGFLKAQGLYIDSLLTIPADSNSISKEQFYWTHISFDDHASFLELSGWGTVICYYEDGEKSTTGLNAKLSEKSYASYRNIIEIKGNQALFKLKADYPLFQLDNTSISSYSRKAWHNSEYSRLLFHGLFFGIIIVMALYNLMIFLAVKDQSYIWYVLSIIGFGFYMAYYYGFTAQFIWPEWPKWNAYFNALIIPLTNISRILFTKTYLHTREYTPVWHKGFNLISILYVLPILGWVLSSSTTLHLLPTTNFLIGISGTITMTSITLVSVVIYSKGYKPALWFLIAFVLFNIGGILFIFQELNYLNHSFITQYVVQIGAVAQVILFSLGLSSRLNLTQKMLNQQTLEKEKLAKQQEAEKKRFLEKQRNRLEDKVKQRTKELETTLKQLKASESDLRELNMVKTRLFSIISHELKSPLTTVDSFLNLLINHYKKLTPEELSELSNQTQFALQNLTLLLDNLLLWSRLQQDKVRFEPQQLELYRLIDRAIKLFAMLIKQKNINIKVDSNVDDVVLFGDKDMLEFITRNLLHNAIKFTPKNGNIDISASTDDSVVTISISDSGVGMSKDMIHQILNKGQGFTREGTEQEKGSGIGLIICKDFVEKNGGTLNIKSEKGTSVIFSLPTANT